MGTKEICKSRRIQNVTLVPISWGIMDAEVTAVVLSFLVVVRLFVYLCIPVRGVDTTPHPVRHAPRERSHLQIHKPKTWRSSASVLTDGALVMKWVARLEGH